MLKIVSTYLKQHQYFDAVFFVIKLFLIEEALQSLLEC